MERLPSARVKRHRATLLIIGVVVIVSLGAWYGSFVTWVHFGFHKDPSSASFQEFMARWGEVLALVATIVVGILAALIPSRLEPQVERIAERLQ